MGPRLRWATKQSDTGAGALNSCPPALGALAQFESYSRGAFLSPPKPDAGTSAILVNELKSCLLKRLADRDDRALMQRLALFEPEHCVWADAGHHGKVLYTDPEGGARHLALRCVQICWLQHNVRRIHQ
jgi:hypothetical protein